MSIEPIEMLQATADTFLMVGVATVVACVLGLPLGFLVVVTSPAFSRGQARHRRRRSHDRRGPGGLQCHGRCHGRQWPGRFGIRYGYQRFQTDVMVLTTGLMIGLIQLFQIVGDAAIRRISHARARS